MEIPLITRNRIDPGNDPKIPQLGMYPNIMKALRRYLMHDTYCSNIHSNQVM